MRSGSTRLRRRASCVFLRCTTRAYGTCGDQYLLRVPRLARAAARVGHAPARPSAMRCTASTSSGSRPLGSPQPRPRGPAAVGSDRRERGATRARSGRRLRRRFRDRLVGSLRVVNRADVVLSTVDTVGIPLMLLGRSRRVRPPLVYTAIGLPERLAQFRTERMRRLYARCAPSALRVFSRTAIAKRTTSLAGEDHGEATEVSSFRLASMTTPSGPHAPFDGDVVTVGADPHRDVELFLHLARTLPLVVHLVTTADGPHARVDCRGMSRSRSISRSRWYGSRLEAHASLRCRCSTTRTRARRRCCCRRWLSRRRSS